MRGDVPDRAVEREREASVSALLSPSSRVEPIRCSRSCVEREKESGFRECCVGGSWCVGMSVHLLSRLTFLLRVRLSNTRRLRLFPLQRRDLLSSCLPFSLSAYSMSSRRGSLTVFLSLSLSVCSRLLLPSFPFCASSFACLLFFHLVFSVLLHIFSSSRSLQAIFYPSSFFFLF